MKKTAAVATVVLSFVLSWALGTETELKCQFTDVTGNTSKEHNPNSPLQLCSDLYETMHN